MSTPRAASGTVQPGSPEHMMSRLLDFEPKQAPFFTLYLDARVNEHGRRTIEPFIRKRLYERARQYAPNTLERESFDADVVRVNRYLQADVKPPTQGIAIFACSAANDFFEAGQFEAPIERNQLFVSDRPHLYPLARLIDQYRRYAVVVADTNCAHIFVFAEGRTLDRKSVQNVKTKHAQIGGWSQNRYQRHVENYHLHHAKEIVEVLEGTVREDNIEQIILAGDETTIIPLLREQLPKDLLLRVVDQTNLAIDTPEHDVLEESLKLFRRHDSLTDIQKVQQLMNEYGADGLAVIGPADTIAAASNGQAEEILITATPAKLQYDEAEVNKVLTLYGGDRPASLDQRSVADELVKRATQLSSARVTFIEDSNVLEDVGGVGALLRYRISREHAVPYEDGGSIPQSQALVKEGNRDV
ncbi:MAG: Vms1/Ankzf1 family peptidyl-tRNA hydrolase [Pyrinomonadaceae bacterium]